MKNISIKILSYFAIRNCFHFSMEFIVICTKHNFKGNEKRRRQDRRGEERRREEKRGENQSYALSIEIQCGILGKTPFGKLQTVEYMF